MPSQSQLRQRGGLRKIRSKKLPGGKVATVYVVGRAGPRGGHTMVGEIKKGEKK